MSSGTWSAYAAVERELAREDRSRGAADDCAALASRVVERSPALEAARQRAQAALARGRSEGALPAPELMLEVWDFPIGDPQLADREGMYMAGIAQRLPPLGALDARARAGVERAKIALGELAEARGALHARALEVCVTWSAAELQADRVRRSEENARRMRELLVAQVRAGAATTVADVARLDAELARLDRVQLQLQGEAAQASARLGAWLDEAPPSSPPPLALPQNDAGVEGWIERALDAHGGLRAARARVRAAVAMADAADASADVPTFTIRATYMQMPSARAGAGVAASMSLPWLWSGHGAARDAARLEVGAAEQAVLALEREVRAQVHAAAVELDVASRALALLRDEERPAAERALDAVEARLPTGSADVADWLQAARALRALDEEEARLVGRAARAWAGLERAVGEALASVEASDE